MKKILLFIIVLVATNAFSQTALSEYGILDPTANGGINPETGVAWADGDTYRFVFVTDATTTALSTNISTYNAFVNTVADGSTIPNLGNINWFAIASTGAVDAIDNTQTNGGADGAFFFVDGTTSYAEDISVFWAGHTSNLNINEDGNVATNPVPGNANWGRWGATWTGSNISGTEKDGTKGLGTSSVNLGLTTGAPTPNYWIDRGTDGPDSLAYMYAMSEALEVCITQNWYSDLDGDGYPDGALANQCDSPGAIWKLGADLAEGPGTPIDCDIDDPNLTTPGNPCIDDNEFTIEEFVNDDCECVAGAIIPTLSQWGIIALAMIMLILGLVFVRQRKVIFES